MSKDYLCKLIELYNRMKFALKIFLYVSVLALLIYLIKIDYVAFEKLPIRYPLVSVSTLLLYLGFIFSAMSWRKILEHHHVKVSAKEAIVSHGMPTFTKYIPGRVWTILGRAALIEDKSKGLKFLSFVSLKEQLIYLNLGLFISIYPVFSTPQLREYSILLVVLSISMFLVLFLKAPHILFETIWNKFSHKKITIPLIGKKEFLAISGYIFLYWILWSTGFYILLISVFGETPFYFSFAFPLSVSLGLISIILPGGIGVREGVITLFLIANGIQPDLAASFSVFSRLWFIVGEVLIFCTALILRGKG